jgi:hypothetical protein
MHDDTKKKQFFLSFTHRNTLQREQHACGLDWTVFCIAYHSHLALWAVDSLDTEKVFLLSLVQLFLQPVSLGDVT